MWDYDKLFAEGNIVGFKHSDEDQIHPYIIYEKNDCMDYFNDSLCYKSKDFISEIQYIIRLDEHGNVIEKLFDREVDMPKPMPKLETGMFVRVGEHKDNILGFIDAENNHIIYQDGGYDFIDSDGIYDGVVSAIIEIYGKDTLGFRYCRNDEVIWRSQDYQAYLDSKSN